MIVLDANILLYAYNADAPEHKPARRWLNGRLEGPDWIGLPWLTIWAFLRISTNPRLFPRPLTVDESFSIVRAWLASPRVVVVEPGPRHGELLEELVRANQAAGPLVTDAALASIAKEHGASLVSTDRDFARFSDLDWLNPLAAPTPTSQVPRRIRPTGLDSR